MPYAVTPDNVKLYYEEVGQGTPILFVHEFASDHRGWEPQLREFGKRHRCIAYSARGYTPSDVPDDPNAYTYQHVMRDAVAVLDHLKIDSAHLIGLSMGGYTSLQVALNHPRARALDGARRHRLGQRALVHARTSTSIRARSATSSSARARRRCRNLWHERRAAFRSLLKDPRGFAEFAARLAEHDAARLGPYLARLPGRAALALRFRGRDQKARVAGADRGRRRGRPLHRAEPVPEADASPPPAWWCCRRPGMW